MKIKGYKAVELVGDCDKFALGDRDKLILLYTLSGGDGIPQRVTLDADSEEDALLEAAAFLDCKEQDLEIEWN